MRNKIILLVIALSSAVMMSGCYPGPDCWFC